MKKSALLAPLLLLVALMSAALAEGAHTVGYERYARVDRADGTYREMYIPTASAEALRKGEPMPTGTIIQMETYYSPGSLSTIFVKQWNGKEWLWGSYSAGAPMPAFGPDMSCTSCHRRSAEVEGTYTKPMLDAYLKGAGEQVTTCDRSGRTPCGPEVYLSSRPVGAAP